MERDQVLFESGTCIFFEKVVMGIQQIGCLGEQRKEDKNELEAGGEV